jgi:hypothetical protein
VLSVDFALRFRFERCFHSLCSWVGFIRLAQEVVSLSSTNGLSGVGISTLADWYISTFFRFAQEMKTFYRINVLALRSVSRSHSGLLAVAREPGFGCRFKELKS